LRVLEGSWYQRKPKRQWKRVVDEELGECPDEEITEGVDSWRHHISEWSSVGIPTLKRRLSKLKTCSSSF